MNEGVIRGGWPFVWAAYAVTTFILTGYATSVFPRYRSLRHKREQVRP